MGCSTSLRSAWLPVTEPGFQPDSCVATLLRLSTDSGAGGRKPARQHGVREAPQVSGSPEGERRAGFWSQRPYLGGLRVQEGAGPRETNRGKPLALLVWLLLGSKWPRRRRAAVPGLGPSGLQQCCSVPAAYLLGQLAVHHVPRIYLSYNWKGIPVGPLPRLLTFHPFLPLATTSSLCL